MAFLTAQIKEDDKNWEIQLPPNSSVHTIEIDWSFAFLLTNGVYVKIESPFTFSDQRNSIQLSMDTPALLGPVLGILRKECIGLKATKSGILTVSFEEDMKIVSEADPRYEAWTTGVSGLGFLICYPGGEVIYAEKPQLNPIQHINTTDDNN